MTDDSPAVRLSAVRLDRGGRAVLSDIDLVVPRGGITAVLGPSGSGKSTLLAALTGELEPAAGAIEVLGAGRARARPARRVPPHGRGGGLPGPPPAPCELTISV